MEVIKRSVEVYQPMKNLEDFFEFGEYNDLERTEGPAITRRS